jgi:esterase/lipase
VNDEHPGAPAAGEHPIRTTARWIGSQTRPLLGWLTAPVDRLGRRGVVVLPPIGYEYSSAHRTLRTLAERLAGQGCSVLRVDYDGTGDSSGDQSDPDRLIHWSSAVGLAARELRQIGASSISLVGLQLGATFALSEGGQAGAEQVVAWAAITDGRRYARGIRLLGSEVPPDAGASRDTIVRAGMVFTSETLGALGALSPAGIRDRPAPRVLIIDPEGRPTNDGLSRRLLELGAEVDHEVVSGTEQVLDTPAEYTVTPEPIVDLIAAWVGSSDASPSARVEDQRTSTMDWNDNAVREEVVELGQDRLVGVLTWPASPPPVTVVWLNAGSEPHTGPARAWVEYARALATAGYASLRLDFSGWGESPDLARAPGRPYDLHGIQQAADVVTALRGGGHRRIVLAGLCAGAWIALQVARTFPVDGVVAINPQLYWQPGDPVEADIVTETRVRRAAEIERFALGARTGMWTAQEAAGIRHPAADWLDDLRRSGTPYLALFAEGDDGLQFLEDRVARAWRDSLEHGAAEVVMIKDIDHAMHRQWRRPDVVAAVIDFLTRRIS